jgi:hypothetical protein
MKKAILILVLLAIPVLLTIAGIHLWKQRPWRTAVSVNSRVLTVAELELRAKTLLEDAKRSEKIIITEKNEAEALKHYRLDAARKWILKEVLLSEAVAQGMEATISDEKEALARLAKDLKKHNTTVEDFFRKGPLPEDIKHRDFREIILIQKFTTKEVADKITLKTEEIEARMVELKKIALAKTKPNEKPKLRWDRKYAIDQLRAERYNKGFRTLFRKLYQKAIVKSPEYPILEKLDGVSPPRPEDNEKPATASK